MLRSPQLTVRHRGEAPPAQGLPQIIESMGQIAREMKMVQAEIVPSPETRLSSLTDSNSPATKSLVTQTKFEALVLDILRQIDIQKKIAGTTLKDHLSFKEVVIYNLIAAPFTGLSGFLYFSTTDGDAPIVVIDTAGANLGQNQYFMVESIKGLYEAGFSDELKNRLLFGAIFSAPYGISTYISASATNQIINILGWKVNPLMQGILNATGNIPLNLYARDQVLDVFRDMGNKFRHVFCSNRKESHLATIRKIQGKAVSGFQAYIDTLKEQDDLKDIVASRKFPLPKQLNLLLDSGKQAPEIPQEDSLAYKGCVFLCKWGGVTVLVWSSLGYGASMAIVIIMLGGSIVISHLSGHGMMTPLYVLSANAGTSLSKLPELPWLAKKFFTDSNYRAETWPEVAGLTISVGMSIYSFGASLDLLQYLLPVWFARSQISQGITIGGTDVFNVKYFGLPNEAIFTYASRWVVSWCSPEKATLQDKYSQMNGRLKQIAEISPEIFVEVVKVLKPRVLREVFCLSSSDVAIFTEAVNQMDIERRFAQAKVISEKAVPPIDPSLKKGSDQYKKAKSDYQKSVAMLIRGTLGIHKKPSDLKTQALSKAVAPLPSSAIGAAQHVISIDSTSGGERDSKASLSNTAVKSGYTPLSDKADDEVTMQPDTENVENDFTDIIPTKPSSSSWCCRRG